MEDNPYAELDSIDAADKVDPSKKKREEAPVRGRDGQFKPKPEEKAVTEPKPEEGAAAAQEEPAPKNTSELRKRYDQFKAEVTELRPLRSKLEQAEARIQELETTKPDLKPFQEKLTALETENKTIKDELRRVNYRKHPEFTDKYEKPYKEAWTKAVSEVNQLNIETESGTVRKANQSDLLALANVPLDQLDDLAEKQFGRSAARVIRHVEKIRDLAEAQDKAIAEAEKGAGEHETRTAKERAERDTAVSNAYSQSNTELVKKYPKWFAPDPADKEGNEILRKGFEFADAVFSDNGGLTPEQKAKRLSVVRAKAANHDRLASRERHHLNRIKELEESLKQYESSEPGTSNAGSPSIGGEQNYIRNANAELDSLDRK